MTDKLPPNLLALFAPRPALRYLPHGDHASEDRRTATITGVAQYLDKLKEPDDYKPTESWLEKRDRKKLEKKEKQEKLLTEGFAEYDPSKDSQVRGDPYRTLFVARLSYDTKEADLEREFGRFGPIERIRIVTNSYEDDKKPKKHRGYAFIVYERERDMKAAYKETDGIRIKDRRVLVDVERGRTVKGWRPRRYGGGLGGRGYTKTAPPRPTGPLGFNAPSGPGGFRGGFRGGFAGRGGFRDGPPGRGGYGQGRGGIGYQGGGGFGRGGPGGPPNGFGGGGQAAPPPNAPSGPSGNRAGGGGYGPGGYGGSSSHGGSGVAAHGDGPPNGPRPDAGGYGESRGGRSYDDSRSSYRGSRPYPDGGDSRMGGGSGSNREPVRPRDGAGYRDRDRDGGYSSRHKDDDHSSSRKRHYDDDRYDDPRQRRRY